MDEEFKYEGTKRGFNPLLVVGVLVGVAVIGIAIYFLSFKPPMEQQTAQILADALREGSPEFAAVNKDIIISTDDKTVESPTGMGTISMYIHGNIKNKGDRKRTRCCVKSASLSCRCSTQICRRARLFLSHSTFRVLTAKTTAPISVGK